MSRADARLARLTPQELDFIVTTVTTKRTDYERIREIIRSKPDFIKVMLQDERLFERVVNDDEILLRISPYLLFTIFLRRAQKDLTESTYTIEQVSRREKIPVFDASGAAELVEDEDVRDYLADMLSSFTRTNSITVYYRKGSFLYKRSYSDMDVDDMIALADMVEDEFKFGLYKRIGDICLFLTGLYPEHVFMTATGKGSRAQRTMSDYEREGIEFYRQAAQQEAAEMTGLQPVLELIATRFNLARKPLNLIATKYIPAKKQRIFKVAPN